MPSQSSSSSLAAAAAAGATAMLLTTYLYSQQRRKLRRQSDMPMPSLLGQHDPALHPDNGCIYLDYNGTTPIYSLVLQEMLPYLTIHYGNPSSGHWYGREPKEAVALARRRVMSLLVDNSTTSTKEQQQAADDCITFTGCGTESDNLAIQLALLSTATPPNEGGKRKHVVTCNIEHPAILECLKVLESRNEIDLTIVAVDNQGIVSVDDIAKAIIPKQTALVTIMLANNEVGSLQPIKDIAQLCRGSGVLFHTDAAQAVGKVSVALKDLGSPDMITLVGHKMGAPKGVAALYIRPGCLSENGRRTPNGYGSCGLALIGGGQECGRRAGTENVPYIVAMGKAADLLTTLVESDGRQQWRHNAEGMERLCARLLANLRNGLGVDNVRVNGPSDSADMLPNTLSVGLHHIQSGELLQTISDKVAASAGSACHASGGGVSSVLKCMNVPDDFARGTLRLSVGPGTTMEHVDAASDIIVEEAKCQLRIPGRQDKARGLC